MPKKTTKWNSIRAKLKKEFLKKEIVECELRWPGCWIDNALSFAHLDKRRYLTDEELTEVVLLCVPCHQKVEYKTRPEMRSILKHAINQRNGHCF